MSSLPQDLYATNLRQNFGYPLRCPEPISTLEPYDKEGFQIGDVGYVNDYGEFVVLFNASFPLPDDLRECGGIPPYKPIKFAKPYRKHAALPEHHLFMTGVQQDPHVNLSRGGYEFIATSNTGAILILPSGATLSELQNKQELEALRKIASKYALSWCKYAQRDSLYLLTGLYKTRSWTLGSFHKGSPGDKILVDRNTASSGAYRWTPAFEMDCRPGPQSINYENQTILIKGFKMTVKWSSLPVIEWVAQSESQSARTIASILAALLALLDALLVIAQKWLSRTTVEHSPRLSQPLHPSDIINRYLLDKNFSAWVAVTHDNEWIDMVERKNLPQEDLMQEARLRDFLAKKYSWYSRHSAVYLRSQIENTDDAHNKLKSSQPTSVTEDVQSVITHIRAENVIVGLGRIPVGFYVQLQFHGTSKRTTNKPVPVDGCVIQWDDQIHLPSDPSAMVQLAVCASFEVAPMLGRGESLCTYEISVGNLLHRTHRLIAFSQREGEVVSPCSSLLIAVQQWHCNHTSPILSQVDDSLDGEVSSKLGTLTDQGHHALLRYHKYHSKEDLELSVARFEQVLDICPDTHTCRAAALFNLATAIFITSQTHGTSLDFAIFRYREALGLRPDGHPDRPATLLYLSEALLHHYEATGYEASPEGELQKLINELIRVCPKGSHERRAADLVLQTYERFRLRNSDDLAELEKLISWLDGAAQEPPEDYLDRRPIRFNNLGLALLRRFELRREPDDLDRAVESLEDAVRLTPDSHLDKPSYLSNLSNALFARFRRLRGIDDLDQAIVSLEDATRLIPDCHLDKHGYLSNFSDALLARFRKLEDIADLDRAIKSLEGAVRVIPNNHPAKPTYTDNLSNAFLARFQCHGGVDDLGRAISGFEDAHAS